jgi:hypothetical protein
VKTFWLIVAGTCIAVAAVFLWRGDFDTAFVVAVLGMIAWFLNYRIQMKAIIIPEDSVQEESVEEKDSNEE